MVELKILDPNSAWKRGDTANEFSVEVTAPNAHYCPVCGLRIMTSHNEGRVELSDGKVEYWFYRHPCGAELVVYNQ